MRILPPIVAALIAVPAAAQEPDTTRPTHVPIEFIEKLVISPFGTQPTPLIGQLPARLTELLRPDPTVRVIGTMDYGVFTMSVVVAPGAPGAVREQWTARLTQAGWAPAPEQGMMTNERGFLARGEAPEPRATPDRGWCSASGRELIRLNAEPHAGDSAAVSLVYGEANMASECDPRPRSGEMQPMLPIPTLELPPGASLRGSSSGGGMDEGHADARVRSDLSLVELGAHYAAEMMREGWIAGNPALGEDVVAQPFRRTDEQDREWLAVLTITRMSMSVSALHLRLVVNR